jgi:hypothetical protein
MMMAVHAGPWEIAYLRLGKGFSVGDLVELHPCQLPLHVRLIGPYGEVIFRSAGYTASTATDTFIQVDHHSILVALTMILLFSHDAPRI